MSTRCGEKEEKKKKVDAFENTLMKPLCPFSFKQALLKSLKERREKNIVIEQIGDLFIDVAEDFKLYSRYCCNYDSAISLLNKSMSKEKLANFIKVIFFPSFSIFFLSNHSLS